MKGKYKFDFNIPQDVKDILNLLHYHNFEAYIVGGCVRDLLLHKEPKDYDITTDATPTQIKRVFEKYELINNNGEKHGTITVRYNQENYEITTYRLETTYSDHRHPDSVKFTSNLEEDLSRRDFTINALVYDGKYVLDYFGGVDDLHNKVIRAVGNPEERFSEDALRILRAIRFASKLDCEIEEKTLNAMLFTLTDLNYIAKERIQAELNKMIIYPKFCDLMLNTKCKYILTYIIPELGPTLNFDQKNKYHPHTLFEHTINVVSKVESNDYRVKLAALLHDIGKVIRYQEYVDSSEDEPKIRHHYIGHPLESYKLAKYILMRLKYSNSDAEFILYLIRYHDSEISKDNPKKSIKKMFANMPFSEDNDLLTEMNLQLFNSMLLLQRADRADHINFTYDRFVSENQVRTLFDEILEDGDCLSLKNLKIGGKELISLGLTPGKTFGLILDDCLKKVIDEELPNTTEDLLEYVKNHYIV